MPTTVRASSKLFKQLFVHCETRFASNPLLHLPTPKAHPQPTHPLGRHKAAAAFGCTLLAFGLHEAGSAGGVVASMVVSQTADPGSIPGRRKAQQSVLHRDRMSVGERERE